MIGGAGVVALLCDYSVGYLGSCIEQKHTLRDSTASNLYFMGALRVFYYNFPPTPPILFS